MTEQPSTEWLRGRLAELKEELEEARRRRQPGAVEAEIREVELQLGVRL